MVLSRQKNIKHDSNEYVGGRHHQLKHGWADETGATETRVQLDLVHYTSRDRKTAILEFHSEEVVMGRAAESICDG